MIINNYPSSSSIANRKVHRKAHIHPNVERRILRLLVPELAKYQLVAWTELQGTIGHRCIWGGTTYHYKVNNMEYSTSYMVGKIEQSGGKKLKQWKANWFWCLIGEEKN